MKYSIAHGNIPQKNPRVRKIFVLGPEMGAPILWAHGIFAFFLQENLHVHKIPRFTGGGGGHFGVFLGGGGECRFYFYWRGDFADFLRLFAFVCVCLRLRAFSCILGPFLECPTSAFVCVCARFLCSFPMGQKRQIDVAGQKLPRRHEWRHLFYKGTTRMF